MKIITTEVLPLFFFFLSFCVSLPILFLYLNDMIYFLDLFILRFVHCSTKEDRQRTVERKQDKERESQTSMVNLVKAQMPLLHGLMKMAGVKVGDRARNNIMIFQISLKILKTPKKGQKPKTLQQQLGSPWLRRL